MHAVSIRAALILAVSLVVSARGVAGDQGPRVLYSTVSSSSSADVPVLSGVKFKWFDRPYASSDGNRLIFSAHVNSSDPNADEVIVLRQALATPDPNHTRVVREGDTISGSVKNGPFRGSLAVDPNGNFVYSTNTTAADPNDELLRRYTFGDPGSFAGLAYEQNTEGPNTPPIRLGRTLDSPSMCSNGSVAFRAACTRWWPSDPNLTDPNKDEYLFWVTSGGSLTTIVQSGVDSPSGAVPSGKPWQFFDPDSFQVTRDASHWLVRGDLRISSDPNTEVPSDDVLARDNVVLMQEGQALGGSGPAVGHIYRAALFDPNGDWMAYGSYAGTDPNDFLVYNGSVIATTDANVPCDGTDSFVEKYTDAQLPRTFFLIAGNGAEYVYGGATNNGDPNVNEVLMYRRPHSDPNYDYHFPVLRAGNRVDLDQNGVLDSNDPRILSFKENSAVLTPQRVLFCVVELRAAGSAAYVGQALLRFKICLGDVDRDGDVDQTDVDLVDYVGPATCGTSGDVTGNSYVNSYDFALVQANVGCGQQ